jgi:hypothetical protein
MFNFNSTKPYTFLSNPSPKPPKLQLSSDHRKRSPMECATLKLVIILTVVVAALGPVTGKVLAGELPA